MNKKIKYILLGVILLLVIGTGVYAATSILSEDVTYDNSNSTLTSTNVQDALDELYSKVNTCPDDYICISNTTNDSDYNLVNYITNLYKNTAKTTITNNNIKYNYATSVSLMSDRLGGITDDFDAGNIRYYGSSPNNYLYFNCSDYSNQTADTCELWRIIGVFNGKVKIIRDESLGELPWDLESGMDFDNDWTTSTLMNLLNDAYYNNQDTIYFSNKSDNSGIGISNYEDAESIISTLPNTKSNNNDEIIFLAPEWYYEKSYPHYANFASGGLGLNYITRNMIDETLWNLRLWSDLALYSDQIYSYESDDSSTEWTGMIGLTYLSDYSYATDFITCEQQLSNYSTTTNCNEKNWLFGISEWSLAVGYSTGPAAWSVSSSGNFYEVYTYFSYEVRPVLYLNPGLSIKDGNGTINNPYSLGVIFD